MKQNHLVLLTGMAVAGCLAVQITAAQVRVMQSNSRDSVLHLINPDTNEIVQEIGGLPILHGVAAAPDGSRIYASSEAENALKVVDTATFEVIATVPLTSRPHNISVTPDGRKIYVGIISEPGTIDVVDTERLEKINSIAVPGGIHNIYVTPDGRNVVAGSIAGRRLTILDTETDSEVWAWEGEAIRPVTIATHADGSTDKLYIQVSGFHGFVEFDWATRRELRRVELPEVPPEQRYDSTYNGAPAHGIGVAPDGSTVWSTSRMNSHVYVYSLPALELLASIPTGTDPDWITFSPDSTRAYVANAVSNSVSVIDMQSFTEVTRISVGESPKRNGIIHLPGTR